MIHEVTGDILLTRADAIVHGVAPNDSFTNGLALSLRERWPAMHKDFRHYCHNRHPEPGEVWTWSGAGGVRIVNLLTQEQAYDHGSRPGKASLPHVNHALHKLVKEIKKKEIKSIALPKIATGVGGLEWKDVKPIIEKQLGNLEIPIYIYTTYRPNQEAVEPQA